MPIEHLYFYVLCTHKLSKLTAWLLIAILHCIIHVFGGKFHVSTPLYMYMYVLLCIAYMHMAGPIILLLLYCIDGLTQIVWLRQDYIWRSVLFVQCVHVHVSFTLFYFFGFFCSISHSILNLFSFLLFPLFFLPLSTCTSLSL